MMLQGRELIDTLKKMDFEMLLDLSETMKNMIEREGADSLSAELVEFDIGLHKAISERMNDFILAEKKVKELLCD